MKYAKTVGLAVVGAAAMLAIVGACTASATVLCKNNESTSYCGEPYAVGTEITSSLSGESKAKFKTEFKTIECSKSTVSGTIEIIGSESTAVRGALNTLAFEECNCTVSVLKKGAFEIQWISGSTNGTVKENGAEVTASCSTVFGTVHCIYATENTDLGTLTGGNPAKIDMLAEMPKLSTSVLCGEEAKWETSYEVTGPNPVFVTELAGLVLRPDIVLFKKNKNNELMGEIEVENPQTGVDIKNLKVDAFLEKDFEPEGKCAGFSPKNSLCKEMVLCKNAGASGLFSMKATGLYLSVELKC